MNNHHQLEAPFPRIHPVRHPSTGPTGSLDSSMNGEALQLSSALIGCSEKPQPAASILGSIFVIRTAASWISWEVKLVTVALEMRLGQNARFKPHRSRPSCVPHVTFPVHRSDLPENFNGTGTLLVLPQP
ncbi:hypothetical protein SKAU_G00293880 [Synaphobranchus kaupii]|uniref:Uncharacterized protein n=1 Tax=Synaphobranchus kaupii TaxID=118154 RepID=A0A9Q1EUF3_SYNKA|nr:hypothetical protein SKAU_G00293880 [Synaphobranchus kaupii]